MEGLVKIGTETKEKLTPLTYHHARPIETVQFGIVKSVSPLNYFPEEDRDLAVFFNKAYEWLEKELGFYPLFLAAGRADEDRQLTGYPNQWRLDNRSSNYALFSFRQIPENGRFVDFDAWHMVLNLQPNEELGARERQTILRPSWIRNDWISYANKYPGSVQYVVPSLDLRTADSVWVRNQESKRRIERLGFKDVSVVRMKIN
jgi:hypothetical protein